MGRSPLMATERLVLMFVVRTASEAHLSRSNELDWTDRGAL